MDTLLELERAPQETVLSLAQACALSIFITATTLLGVTHGKHMEKTVTHMEIPTIHNGVRTSRRLDE